MSSPNTLSPIDLAKTDETGGATTEPIYCLSGLRQSSAHSTDVASARQGDIAVVGVWPRLLDFMPFRPHLLAVFYLLVSQEIS